MQHILGVDPLGPPVVLVELVVAGMLGEHMISDRAPVLIELDAHPDLVTIRGALVLFLIDQIGLQELERESVLVAVIVDDSDQRLAVSSHRLDDHCLGVGER